MDREYNWHDNSTGYIRHELAATGAAGAEGSAVAVGVASFSVFSRVGDDIAPPRPLPRPPAPRPRLPPRMAPRIPIDGCGFFSPSSPVSSFLGLFHSRVGFPESHSRPWIYDRWVTSVQKHMSVGATDLVHLTASVLLAGFVYTLLYLLLFR